MSAQQLDGKAKRRRGLRRQAEDLPEEPLDEVEDDGEDDESEARGISERKGRATPSRRQAGDEVEEQQGNFITRPIYTLREYIEGVRSEMGKVVWPTREEAQRLTGIVLSTMVVSALVLGALSFVYNEIFVIGLRTPMLFGVIFVIAIVGFGAYLRMSNRRTSSY
jgi:preprotein translocase subunit SecE